MLELLSKLLTWGTVTRTQDADGYVQVDVGEPRPLEKVIQLGLPGAYSKALATAKVVLLRLLTGSIAFAADTEPPADVTDGECGWRVGDTLIRLIPSGTGAIAELRGGATPTKLRVYPDGTVEITGAKAVDGILLDGAVAVARHGDSVPANAGMAAWMTAVEAHTHVGAVPVDPTLAGPPAAVGSCAASTTKVKAG